MGKLFLSFSLIDRVKFLFSISFYIFRLDSNCSLLPSAIMGMGE